MSDIIVISQRAMPITRDYGDIVIRAISGLFSLLQYPPKTGIFAIIKNHSHTQVGIQYKITIYTMFVAYET